MTYFVKISITTVAALVLVNIPTDKLPNDAYEINEHNVESLIKITTKELKRVEAKVDSMLIARGDSLIQNQITNDTTDTE